MTDRVKEWFLQAEYNIESTKMLLDKCRELLKWLETM